MTRNHGSNFRVLYKGSMRRILKPVTVSQSFSKIECELPELKLLRYSFGHKVCLLIFWTKFNYISLGKKKNFNGDWEPISHIIYIYVLKQANKERLWYHKYKQQKSQVVTPIQFSLLNPNRTVDARAMSQCVEQPLSVSLQRFECGEDRYFSR